MPTHYPHPLIAREGWPFLFVSVLVAAVLTPAIGWWSAPLWLVALFVLQFFRDPARVVPSDPSAVLSPADGRIVVVEKALDPYRQQEALKISVFMNVFNVHSNRSPVDGTVEKVEYHAGSFLNAALAKASLENERNAVLLKTPDGTPITFVQIAGLVARRILCYTRAGDTLTRGQRYGFIRFGSRVDVYLPLSATPCVAIGDKVSATCTVLAKLA
jgi:phosphatidylserine decarboxylase